MLASTAGMGVAVRSQKAMPKAKRHQLSCQTTNMEECFKTRDVKLAEADTHADEEVPRAAKNLQMSAMGGIPCSWYFEPRARVVGAIV